MHTSNIVKEFINVCFPAVCLHCHERIPNQDLWLCGNCTENLLPIPEPNCPHCGTPCDTDFCLNCAEMNYSFHKAYSLFLYQGPAKSLIHALKYNGYTSITDWIAKEAYKKFINSFSCIDIICPIPLHPVKQRERGYNQSALIAEVLASMTGKVFLPKLLRRKWNNEPQTKLDRKNRLVNLKDIFKIDNVVLSGKNVLLIDDVFTTGSTVNEASKVLLKAGANQVNILTVCHGV